VHPIEHLRYVARARGADPTSLAIETASALQHLAFDQAGLVVACRRVVERHPTAGLLWWTCAHLLTAPDPRRRAGELISELYADPTEDRIVADLPTDATVAVAGMPSIVVDALCRRGDLRVIVIGDDRRSGETARRLARADVDHDVASFAEACRRMPSVDLVLVEADAADRCRAFVELGGGVLAAVARAAARPVWVVAGRGRTLPTAYADAISAAVDSSDPPLVDELDLAAASTVVGPDGAWPAALDARSVEDCPFAAELVLTPR
jgi:hypothetical protein